MGENNMPQFDTNLSPSISIEDLEDLIKQKQKIIQLLLELIQEKITSEIFLNDKILVKMNSKLKKPYRSALDKIDNWKTNLKQLNNENQELLDKSTKDTLKIEQLNFEKDNLDKINKSLQSEIDSLKQDKSDLELKIINLLNSKIEIEKNKNAEINSLNDNLNKITNSLEKQIANFQKNIFEINEMILNQQLYETIKDFLKQELIKKMTDVRKKYLIINWDILQKIFKNLSIKITIDDPQFIDAYQNYEYIQEILLNMIIEYYKKEINKSINGVENIYSKILTYY